MDFNGYLSKVKMQDFIDIPWNEYPFNIPAVRDITNIDFHPCVTFFAGENGVGKSTTIEAIALALGFCPEGGTRNVQISTTNNSVSPLNKYIRLIKSERVPKDYFYLRSESFFNLATYMDYVGYLDGYDGSLHKRSHGEALLAVFKYKLKGRGIYLLDEPEAGLSPSFVMSLIYLIDKLCKDGSQFIICTHSPMLLSYNNATIYNFNEAGIKKISYEETESYKITLDYLNNYSRRLSCLLDDESDS